MHIRWIPNQVENARSRGGRVLSTPHIPIVPAEAGIQCNVRASLDRQGLKVYVHCMFFVYITANQQNGTLYIGQTDDLARRMNEHQSGAFPGFTKKYGCTHLVWFELHETRASAVTREMQMKEWNRSWKIRRIETLNPDWDDLSADWTEADVYDEKRRFTPAFL